MIWQKITDACVRLECLAFSGPDWGRPILYRNIAAVERFALHVVEPSESEGPEIPGAIF